MNGKARETTMPDVLYIADMAARLGMSQAALRTRVAREAKNGKQSLPRHFRIGRKIVWSAAEVDSWLSPKGGKSEKTKL